ncbi:MAG: hypothetical protein JWR37_996 [Mycobacterium sp.]|nr:hypothetical protein [Mycobacterium sp.]
MAVRESRPSAWTWLLAGLELIAALALARLIVWTDRAHAPGHTGHGMAGMPGMAAPPAPVARWGSSEYASIGVAVVALGWWLLGRQAVAAIVAAAAVAVVAAPPAVRVLAAQSHLIAMVALELLMVIVPLLVLSAWRRPGDWAPAPGWGGGWTLFAVGTGLLYSALLIVVHIPAVHHRGGELGSTPLWLAVVATAIGIGYWAGVLRTAGRVPTSIRRAVLLGAQEVAAFIGLLSLFGAWSGMGHDSPLGISAAWDQRLGGLFMMATCAAVTIPLIRRFR